MKHLHGTCINEKVANKTILINNVPDKQIELKNY